ncbi:MAG: serine/threonine protein kinase [Roseburia sp.]|nr:serine/threonine protein kinase [Roseburia sp.]
MSRFERSRSHIKAFVLFGKYRVVSTLGTGGSSTVYLAEHLKLKVYRAIKCIPKDMAGKTSFSLEESFQNEKPFPNEKPFLREADLLKNLNHPGIPLIYDIEEDDAFIYIIEEFIQGESLESFVLHQETIPQELILNVGIQLCDILDYLHQLSPYPILYQDLKPEHIIVCGKQLKLIDFGIASFFTGSGKNFQLYGTDGFTAPEALHGLPVTPAADIYGLGRILEFLANASPECSPGLYDIIKQAAAEDPSERFPTAASLKTALTSVGNTTQRRTSHLIRNIAVIGSKAGAGATHIAVSLVSFMNKKGMPAVYISADQSDTLEAMAQTNPHFKEQDGIFYYAYFRGMPDYGSGVVSPLLDQCCQIWDYGARQLIPSELNNFDLVIYVFGGSDWDMPQALAGGNRLALISQSVFICNHENKRAARKYARLQGKKVYCFPCDPDPYRVSSEKERLISSILHRKGGNKHFWF